MRGKRVACFGPGNVGEPLFRRLVAVIFAEGMLLNGSVIDSGAHAGSESCYYAELDRSRIVHAVEPLPRNAHNIVNVYGDRPNIVVLAAALGSRERTVAFAATAHSKTMLVNVHAAKSSAPSSPQPSGAKSTFRVHRIDGMFLHDGAWAGERLAFGHFDVEGSEADVLEGAKRVIARDRPVFTVEISALRGHASARRLLRLVEEMRYNALLVPEPCGIRGDERNVICVPTERRVARGVAMRTLPLRSDTFDRVHARELLRYNSSYTYHARGRRQGTVADNAVDG